MNKPLRGLFATVVIATVGFVFSAFGGNWTFDGSTLTDGDWSFTAAADGENKLTVNAVTEAPSSVTALDFSKTITDGGSTTYTIVALNPHFGTINGSGDPIAGAYSGFVGELTLPSSGLVSIGDYAFCGCTNATGAIVLPASVTSLNIGCFALAGKLTFTTTSFQYLTQIPARAFEGCSFPDDMSFPAVTEIASAGFRGSFIKRVSFGAALAKINGAYGNGAFRDCTNLVSIAFDENSKIDLNCSWLCYNCSKLESLDLRAVTNIVSDTDDGPFSGCSSLRHLRIGAVPSLPKNFFMQSLGSYTEAAPLLTDVHFYGAAPALDSAWRLPEIAASSTCPFVSKSRMTTFIHLDSSFPTYAADLATWTALASAEPAITGTTWNATRAGSEANAAKRPLLLWQSPTITIDVANSVDADEGKEGYGYFLLTRGDSDPLETTIPVKFAITGTAIAGQTYCSIYPDIDIKAGEKTTKVKVRPLNDPETTADTTVILTLADDASGYYTVGTTRAATLDVKNAEKYGGYLYADAGKWNLLAHMGNTGLGNVTANTPAAAKYCVDHGYAFEVDVQWDADTGVLYLSHDAISGITADWTNTFQNVLKVLPTGAVFKVDAKCSKNADANEAMIAAVKADKTNERATLAFNNDPGTLGDRIHQEFSNVQAWPYSLDTTLSSDPAELGRLVAENDLCNYTEGHSFAWDEDVMTDEFFAEFNKRGITIDVWTVEDPRTIKEIINRGARYVTTNNPFPVTAALPWAADPVAVEKEEEEQYACQWTTELWTTNGWTRPADALAGGVANDSRDRDDDITTACDIYTNTDFLWEFTDPMDLTSLTIYPKPGCGREALGFTNGVLVKYSGSSEFVKLAGSERRCYAKLWDPQAIIFSGTNGVAFATNVVAVKLTPTETPNGYSQVAETVLLGTASSGSGSGDEPEEEEEEEEESSSFTWTTGSYSDEEYVEVENRLNGGSDQLYDGKIATQRDVSNYASFSYHFDTPVDLTDIRIYSRWEDAGRVKFTTSNLWVKISGSSDFVEIPDSAVDCRTDVPSTNRLYAALSAGVGGFIATHVTDLKLIFDFASGYIGVGEIEVAGTPSVTETLTAEYPVTAGQLAATATSSAARYPIDVYFCSGNKNGGDTTNGWDIVTKVKSLASSSEVASWNGTVTFCYARFTYKSKAYAGEWVWSEVGDVAQNPTATTEVGATTHTNAALTATISAFGIPASAADIYLAYGTTENSTDYKLVTKGAVVGANALEMTNLTENTMYYYSVMISNSCDKTSTTGGSFTTPWSPEEQQRPTGTVTVDDIRSSRATANITLTSPGTDADAADIWFASVIHGGEMPALTRIATGVAASGVATKTITGLSGSTVYDYRVVLSNALDRTRELTGSFTTAQAPFDDPDTPTTREIPYRALPTGYTQVEYLRSTGGLGINTGIKSSAAVSLAMDFKPEAYGAYVGQQQDDNTDWRFALLSWIEHMDIGTTRVDSYTKPAIDNRYQLCLGPSVYYSLSSNGVNVVTSSRASGTPTCDSRDIGVFGMVASDSGAFSPIAMTLWSMVMTNDSVQVRDFVPAICVSDGEPGLYDFVSNTFFANCVSGASTPFETGKAVLGVGVTATAAYSFTTKEWTMTFDITSGSGALYAVVQDASGNRKLELVKADATAGDHIVYVLESVVGDEYQIGYKTVAGKYKDYAFLKTTHQKPVGTIASQNFTMTNAEVVVTLTTAGELEPTSDLYFAFAKKGAAMPALTKVATGMSDGQSFTNLCADLDHSTEYDCIAIFSNSVYGSTLEHSFSTRHPCNWTTGAFVPQDFELPEHWLSGGVTENYRDSKVNDDNGFTTLTATSTNAWDFAEAQDVYTIDFYFNSAADRQAGIAFGNILVKYEGADDFVEIPNSSLDYELGGSKATFKASLSSLTGVIATNVVAVRVPATQVNGDNTRLFESVMTGEASHREFVAWTLGECATNEFVRAADAILPDNALLKSYSNIGGVVADGDLNTKTAELSEGHTYEWQFTEAVNVRELDLYSNGGLYEGHPDINRAIFQVASVSAMFKGSSEWTQLGGGSFDKYSFGGQVKVSRMVSCSGAAYALRNVIGVKVVLGKPSLDNAKPYMGEVQLCGASAVKPGFIIIVR